DVSPADKSSDAVQENAASAEKISVDIQMQIWSMKEALMKYSGKGMSRNLLSFSVVPLLTGEIMEEEGRKVVGAGLSLLPDYSLCAVWEGTHFNHPEIKIFSWNELFEEVVTKNKEKP
ncbi:MAG: 4'-phosphopantetheinyl transferase superfamily protein, partial [Lachnospiraceae bacterium]